MRLIHLLDRRLMMKEKFKINFICFSRFTGEILKRASIYIYGSTKEEALTNAYKKLKGETSPNRDDIIVVECL